MANAKAVVVLVAVLALLQVSCTAARRHGKPGPCDAADAAADDSFVDDLLGALRHKKAPHHHCAPARHGGGGTPAVMTVNGFQRGESGGGASACDDQFHSDGELIVALSTEWFARGRRCHRRSASRARATGVAPWRHASWTSATPTAGAATTSSTRRRRCGGPLGLDTDVGEVPVTWSDA
jgi:hypothetical protein